MRKLSSGVRGGRWRCAAKDTAVVGNIVNDHTATARTVGSTIVYGGGGGAAPAMLARSRAAAADGTAMKVDRRTRTASRPWPSMHTTLQLWLALAHVAMDELIEKIDGGVAR